MNDIELPAGKPEVDVNPSEKGSIRRPKIIYFICIWFFLSVGNALDDVFLIVGKLIFKDPSIASMVGIALLYSFLIPVIVGIFKLMRPFLILGGVLMLLLGISLIVEFSKLSSDNVNAAVLNSVFLFSIALTFLSAGYCLRPSFLRRAEQFVAQNKKSS